MRIIDSHNAVDLAARRSERHRDRGPSCLHCGLFPPCYGDCCPGCLHSDPGAPDAGR
jgi:hypothetical protein